MAARDKTLADYVVTALSPLLIMALVGSLVFFLLEVLYQGQYGGTLRHILFFFVFGAVLTARIAMQAEISDRAPIYSLFLGCATWVALLKFGEYPSDSQAAPYAGWINLGLIIIIWWSAHRLTWDCTLIDDDVDASGQGLLEVSGLQKTETPSKPDATPVKEKKKKKAKQEGGMFGWLQRYRKFKDDEKKKPHTPGVWIVYFSLAALPLFGLGQSLIPVSAADRRAYVFWLMVIYVGSGLGLLMTTSFLGLRRYLRQRKLQMPAAITTAWMFLGGILIGSLLLVGAFLPRPAASNPLFNWSATEKTTDLEASSQAQVGDNQGKGKGRSTSGKGKADEKGEGSRSQQKEGAPKEGSDKDGKGQGGDKGDKDGKGESKGSKGEKGSGEKQQGSGPGQDKAKGSSSTGSKEKGDQGKQAQKKQDGSGPSSSPQPSAVPQALGGIMQTLGPILKWIVIIVLVALIAFFIVRSGLRWLANFTSWAQRLLTALQTWWENLWKLWEKPARSETGEETAEELARAKPFSSFTDPFMTGASEQMKPEALVRYTFAAFEAWARDRDIPREPGETPFEFVERISNEAPALEADARRLANLYAGIAYAGHKLDAEGKETLREFWEMLKEVAERPLSAGSREES